MALCPTFIAFCSGRETIGGQLSMLTGNSPVLQLLCDKDVPITLGVPIRTRCKALAILG